MDVISDCDQSMVTDTNLRTPPESIIDAHHQGPVASSIPQHKDIFIIQKADSGEVLTLYQGNILLMHPGGHGSIHWECEDDHNGWLGFRNRASGRYLGHDSPDKKDKLICRAETHQQWERFCIRPVPGGGFVLLMTHGNHELRPVDLKIIDGVQKLAKINFKGFKFPAQGIKWTFIKVSE